MTWYRASRKLLDDLHATAATGAGMLGLVGHPRRIIVGYVFVGGPHWGRGGDQLARTCQRLGLRAGAREKTVVADAVEAFGQDMQHEAPDELGGGKGHGLVAVRPFNAIIFVGEGDGALVSLDQASIGDRHAMRVAREIGEHLLGSGKRALGVDVPVRVVEWFEPRLEASLVGKVGVRSKELQAT